MNEQYFLILVNEGGDVSVEVLGRDLLLSRLNEGYYGEGAFFPKFHEEVPTSYDPMTWGDKRALLIKGSIVTPKAQQIVTQYTV